MSTITNVTYDRFDNVIKIKRRGDMYIEKIPFIRTFYTRPGLFNTSKKLEVEPCDKKFFFDKSAIDMVKILDPQYTDQFEKLIENPEYRKNIYQYDLDPEYQYLIYNSIPITNVYNVSYLDIETNDDIDAENANSEIDIITIITGDDIKTFRRDAFASEKSMLIRFFKYICDELFPDLVLGWNVIGFDRAYLINRAKKIGVNPKLDRFGMIQFINGSDILIKMYGYTVLKETGGMRLEDVCQHFLKKGKTKIDCTPGKLFRRDPEKAVEYNINDVLLVKELDEKLNFVKFLTQLQSVSGVLLRNAFFNSMIIDSMILRRYSSYVFPTRFKIEETEQYEGGYVFVPPKGIFNNVAAFDFSSLYPSIFLTFNISPDTKRNMNYDYVIDNVGFVKQPHGIFKETTLFLYTDRLKLKASLKSIDKNSDEYVNTNTLQLAYKTILNSFYGVCAYKGFRLYDVDIAKSITAVGRRMIKMVKEKVEETKIGEIKYGDTDSCFIKCYIDPDEIAKIINTKFIPEYVNKYGISENFMSIEKEKEYSWIMFFGKKKNYCGKLKGKEEFVIKGLDAIKYDVPKKLRAIMIEIIKDVSENKIIDVFKYRDVIKTLTMDDLIILKKLNKSKEEYKVDPEHLTALNYSKTYLGLSDETYRSSIVNMLYVNNTSDKHPRTKIIAIEKGLNSIPDGFEIDYERYFFFFFLKKLFDVFDVYGFDKVPGYCDYINNTLKDKDKNYGRFFLKLISMTDISDKVDASISRLWTILKK